MSTYQEWETEILEKIDAGEELTTRELWELREHEVDTEYGDNRRWSRSVASVVELKGRFFIIEWEEGLTECQDDEMWEQCPKEVVLVKKVRTITTKSWEYIDED